LVEKVILADETPLQVLNEKDRTNTQKSQMFVFATPKIRFFQYREMRSAYFLTERLRNYGGTLASDGYKSYDTLCRNLKLQHAACWAHVRREFFQLLKALKPGSFAHQIVEEIRKLYAIKARSREKEHPAHKILECRREYSQKIVDRVFEQLKGKRHQIPEDQLLGKAIKYTLGQEPKLRVFLESGDIPIDTNAVENAIRPFVVGRKNWMFSGSPRGADSSALI
jgi:transposase